MLPHFISFCLPALPFYRKGCICYSSCFRISQYDIYPESGHASRRKKSVFAMKILADCGFQESHFICYTSPRDYCCFLPAPSPPPFPDGFKHTFAGLSVLMYYWEAIPFSTPRGTAWILRWASTLARGGQWERVCYFVIPAGRMTTSLPVVY